MLDFFKGWRRKVGTVLLLVACSFMVGWIRSQFLFEYIEFPAGNVAYMVTSMHGGLDFTRMTSLEKPYYFYSIDYKSVELAVDPQDPLNATPWSPGFEFEWRWDWAGFHVGEGRYSSRRDQDCMIPYWFIVIPLTLLSAYLLLRKPRPKPRTPSPN